MRVPALAAAVSPCSGVTVNAGVTKELPPPLSAGAAAAAGPMTAIGPALAAGSGSVPPLFFSSTVPSSATVVATA